MNNNELESLYERAQADDGERPPYWSPEPGEILTGRLLYYSEGVTSIGERRIAVVERHPDGEVVSVWLMKSVLISEFDRLNPQPGDGVVVKYFGERQPKNPNGRPYHLYRLWVSRAQPVADPSTPSPVAASASVSTPRSPSPASSQPEPNDDDLPY
jgi:hypothetical protein